MRGRIRAALAAGVLAVGSLAVGVAMNTTAANADTRICEQFGSTVVGPYVVMNNRWGSSQPQCINVTSTGFSIVQQDGTGNLSGAPVSYPAIYLGCHYSNCSPSSPLPRQISQIGSANTSISLTYPGSGTYDAAYDIWLNADTNVTGVQDTEIMVWLNHTGTIQPIGSQTGTASIAGRSWAVWTGNNGQNNVVSYVNAGITSITFNVMDFIRDTLGRGSQYGNNNWFLTSIQAGFEPWIGGVGLSVNSFSATIGTGGGDTSPPSTPGTLSASGVTASSVNLSWGASSDNMGVTGYEVQRATGGGAFSAVGTSTSTSFTSSGLTASTAYQFRVRARDAAGNFSGFSNTVSVTTSPGGGTTTPPPGGGGCTATYAITNQWTGGFGANITVTNGSSARTSWTVAWTFGNGQTITQIWNATDTASGASHTARNLSYNGALGAGQSTSFGFNGTWNGTNSVPTLTCS